MVSRVLHEFRVRGVALWWLGEGDKLGLVTVDCSDCSHSATRAQGEVCRVMHCVGDDSSAKNITQGMKKKRSLFRSAGWAKDPSAVELSLMVSWGERQESPGVVGMCAPATVSGLTL
jgi:hypothetical protein